MKMPSEHDGGLMLCADEQQRILISNLGLIALRP